MKIGNQQTHQFQITDWGAKKWSLLYLPADFATSGKKYPVIIFNHGLGETGNTEGSLTKLLSQGVPQVISTGHNMTFTNPNTNQQQSFIVVSLQDAYWSPDPEQSFYAIKNDPLIKDRIEGIFYTGLSAGGQTTMNSIMISQVMSDNITGIVPMSSPGSNNNFSYSATGKTKAWVFHGLYDSTTAHTASALFHNKMNETAKRSKLTSYPGGHGGWNEFYNPEYKEFIDGKQMNIYEWMLSLLSPTVVVTQPTTPQKYAVKVVYNDGSEINL